MMHDCYVYTHEYPEAYPDEELAGTVFYVGKGSGNRIKVHEYEARGHTVSSKKCLIVRQIWAYGCQVVTTKRYEHLTEVEAFVREAELIREYGRERLANGQGGHRNPKPRRTKKPAPLRFRTVITVDERGLYSSYAVPITDEDEFS